MIAPHLLAAVGLPDAQVAAEADRRQELAVGRVGDPLVLVAEADRAEASDTASSYTARLLAKGIDTVCKKVGEEATEVVIAAKEHNEPPPRPSEIGGNLHGYFDFSLERGRSAQPFP